MLQLINADLVARFGWERTTEFNRALIVLVTQLDIGCAATEGAARGGMPVDAERYAMMVDLQCGALDELEEARALSRARRVT
jgi:hypothetical protein